MNKIVLLGTFFLLFCMPATEALRCHVCQRYEIDGIIGRCVLGESSCEAQPGQKCIITLVQNGSEKYNTKGCTEEVHECIAVDISLSKKRYSECCDHRENCNAGLLSR